MAGRSRNTWIAAACALAGLAGCAPAAPAARSCSTEEECPAGARCLGSACVQNAPPSVLVTLPADPRANALLTFDASATSDPDPGDAVVSFAWAFRALAGAACAPPAVAGTGPSATVRFGCPGRYAVDVTATDLMGAAATSTEELDVAAPPGPPLLEVGEDLAVDHACSSAPVRCAPAGAIALSAAVPSLPAGSVSFRWTVRPPPDRPLEAGRRVSLVPSALVASPSVAMETDGSGISGDWIFEVEARDAAGVVGAAAVRVSVRNRPPIVAETIPVFDHAYDPATRRFLSSGNIGLVVRDPDGDPLVGRSVVGHHAGDGGASFLVEDQGAAIRVEVAVPYAQPSDAAYLIGGPGLERGVTFTVYDVNGGFFTESWPVVIANRAPAPVTLPPVVSVDHAYLPESALYTATATLSTWSDPDGDPLFPVGGTGDPTCAGLTVVDGAAGVVCAMPFNGVPAVAAFATTRALTHEVRDPWLAAPAVTTPLQIRNRPPRLTATSVGSGSLCWSGTCCDPDPELGCLGWTYGSDPVELDVAAFAADDDGDPLEVLATIDRGTIVPALSVCMPSACAFHVSDPGLTSSCGYPAQATITVRLRDGGPEVARDLTYGGCH